MATSEPELESNPLHDLTAFQRDVLALLDRMNRPCGLDVKSELQRAYDVRDINHGQLYPNLDDLVDRGLVEKGQRDERTNYYELTSRGQRELDAHRDWMGGTA